VTSSNDNGAELMSAYLDAELDKDSVEAFESMLEESEEARQELEDLRKVVALVGGLPKVDAPEDFYEKLNRRLRRRQLLAPEAASKLAMIAIPFQVLSIIVILVVAALYMMAELERRPTTLERDPAVTSPVDADPGQREGPRPVVP
jgi:ferric-dicitrate binding protein FerR (iron transport regulator)